MSPKKSSYVRRKLLQTTVVGREVNFFCIIQQLLKTQKHLVSIVLSWSGFSFYERFNRQFTGSFFYIQIRKMCFSKMILYQYFFSASPLKTLETKNLKRINRKYEPPPNL